jgi:hypothetical protein
MSAPLQATSLLLAAALGAARCAGPGQEGGRKHSAATAIAGVTASATAPPPPETPAFPEVRLGIDEVTFRRLFPEVDIRRYEDGAVQGHWPASVHGVAGSWHYTFKEGKLAWVLFNSYEDAITPANFDRYKAAILAIEANYDRRFGPPIKREVGKQTFQDPRKEHHWGYDVFDAVWKAEGMKIRANFDFMGGKGDYHFLVQMEIEPEDYPYF